MKLPTYAVISPVKDEAAHFSRTAESLLAQTHRPVRWIVVDDGSDDGTAEIADEYAKRHPWITVIRLTPGTRRARGAPVVRAFNAGLAALEQAAEFVVKLDGDLFLPSHYFDWVARAFAADPRVGIAGGLVYVFDKGAWKLERVNVRTVHGAVKAYRTQCLDDIGGLKESMGWDGIDEYGARARGWQTWVLSELQVLHFKQRGSAQPALSARWEEGRGSHYMGYIWPLVLLRVGYRALVEKPRLLGGLTLGVSYVWHTLIRAPQVDDALAKQQLRRDQKERVSQLARLKKAPTGASEGLDGPAFTATGLTNVRA